MYTEINGAAANDADRKHRNNRPVPGRPRKREPIRCRGWLRGWRVTEHARQSCDRRSFDPHQALAAIDSPEEVRYGKDPDTWLQLRGSVCVVVSRSSSTVITVLLGSETPWADDDARAVTGLTS